ncbi:hypothetical protein M422DRAFT_175776, partial [Sphaerobolus stellatus SS14]
RPELRTSGKLIYALFDFDLGLMLASTPSATNTRFPAWRSFEHYTLIIPFLAPFLDRLVFDELNSRFTSSEALAFFEGMHMKLTPAELSAKFPPPFQSGPFWQSERYNRWYGLPEEFLERWSHFRAPAPSLYTKLLRRICLTHWGVRCVCAIRRIMRSRRELLI